MNYQRTIILECNSLNKLHDTQSSNDFEVNVPQILIPKGGSIQLDGAIVEERSAGNDSIIELSNQNYNESRPYISSWSLIELRYFINNSAQNTICQPCIQNNYLNVLRDDRTGPQWTALEIYPNTSTYVIPYKGISYRINQISGPKALTFNTSDPVDFVNNRESWVNFGRGCFAYDNPKFIRWSSTINKFINYSETINIIENVTDADYSQNSGAFKGIVGIKSACKLRSPDSSKYTYMKAGYKGPDILDVSQYTAHIEGVAWKPELEIYTDFIEIDLSKELLETPDELSDIINSKIQGSQIDSDSNLIKIESHTRQWNTKYSTSGEDLYPKKSIQVISNISSKSLINIPANFQNDQDSTVYGEGFFTKDPNRWIGGNSFLKLCNYRVQRGNTYEDVVGNDPLLYKQYINPIDWDAMFNINRGSIESDIQTSQLFPAIQAFSLDNKNLWVQPLIYTTSPQTAKGIWENSEAPENWDNTGNLEFTLTNVEDILNTCCAVIERDNSNVILQYRTCKYTTIDLKLYLDFFPAELVGGLITTTPNSVPDIRCIFDSSILGHKTLTFINILSEVEYILEFNQTSNFEMADETLYNGLPYFAIDTNIGGGRLADESQGVGGVPAEVDEFVCIPDGYIIPTNIKTRGIYTTASIRRVAHFLKLNEKYGGDKISFKEQQNDTANWYAEFDVGFCDDFNCSMANWYSSQSELSGIQYDYTIYDSQQNFSLMPSYYSNITSVKQFIDENVLTTAQSGGYDFRTPLSIYPISRNASMGCNFRSNKNIIRVYSRYFEGLKDIVKIDNSSMDVPFVNNIAGQRTLRTHPLINVSMSETSDFKLPIATCIMKSNDGVIPNTTFGFINFKNTFKGTGRDTVEYDFEKMKTVANYRQCFRLLHLCPMGFDPSAITNSFCNSMNLNQTVATNPMLEAKNFFSNRKYDATTNNPTELEAPVYSDNIVYSGRVEDYQNFIYIGATNPVVKFNNSRIEWSNLYTPRKYNSWDSQGTADPNIGTEVVFFNDDINFFPMLNNTFGSVLSTGPGNGTVVPHAPNNPADFQQIRNTGFNDSLSGIGIQDLYVKGQYGGTLPEHDGVYKSSIDSSDVTTYYKGSLWDLFGFNLRQFKPYYGLPWLRFSKNNYNNIDSQKYEGISYFTLNSFINQSQVQTMDIFGPNYLPPTTSITTIPSPPNMGGMPSLCLGFIGYQKSNKPIASDILRGNNLPSKLQNGFYMIQTNLPTSPYITDNSYLNISGYFFRNWKSGSYYFSYPTSYQKLLTDDLNLSKIKIQILNPNGQLAENIGEKVTCFFKISIPSTLNELDKQELIQLENYEQTKPLPEAPIISKPIESKQYLELKSIISSSFGIPISEVTPDMVEAYTLTEQSIRPTAGRPSRGESTRLEETLREMGEDRELFVREYNPALPEYRNLEPRQRAEDQPESKTEETSTGMPAEREREPMPQEESTASGPILN